MKAKIWIFSSLLVSLFGFSAYNLHSNADKDQLIIKLLMQGLRSSHYEVLAIDDKFSNEVFDAYLKRVDYSKRFLTQADIALLSPYKSTIDDEINASTYEYFDAMEDILNRRTQQVQVYYKEILATPFDFTKDESFELKADKMEFPKDKEDLKDRWYRLLKYQTMTRLADMIEEQNKMLAKKDTVITAKSETEMEAEARAKVLKNTDDYFNRIAKIKMEDRRATFLNTIMSVYDPHTNYFPPDDKENFDISMSGKLEGIGATLQEKDGYIKVINIVPGSPSYRQGDLKENDVIMKVAQGENEPVDIVDMPLDDAVKLVRGKKGTEVRLTVKKPDGAMKVIPIIRDVVIIEETFAKSIVLEDKDKTRYGYVYLPRFYADFQDRKGRRCSEDIKNEIQKLQTEGIEGIILDLRNNGGGSLQDVVDIMGLFIDKGPVVQVKGRSGDPQVLHDLNTLHNGVLYDGKLLVMVNNGSASASEILAAAIQDYKRGVVFGSKSTYGKGTVQRFYNLDDFLVGQGEMKPLGSIKMTTQKFYRVNGGATQLKGVLSDVVVPDNFEYIEVGEKEQEHYMPWDEIKSVPYTLWKSIPNYEQLRRNSKKRVEAHPTFKLIEENAQRLKKQDEEKIFTLNLAAYQQYQKELKTKSEVLTKAMDTPIEAMNVITPKADLQTIKSDSIRTRLHEDWRKDVKSDVYIYEAMQILRDIK